jgi:hypothetical protein
MRRIACFSEFRAPLYQTAGFLKPSKPGKNETTVSNDWRIELPPVVSPQIKMAVKDLKRFLHQGAGIRLATVKKLAKNANGIVLKRAAPAMKPESYKITVVSGLVTVEGADDSGIMYGLFYLEELMKFRGAPVLTCETVIREPALETRIFRSPMAFYYPEPFENLEAAYPDNYLLKLAHGGYNGIWLRVSLRDAVQHKDFPEFGTRADLIPQALRQLVERSSVYGIKVFLYLMEPQGLPADHPIFKRLPHIKGEFYEWEGSCAFCTSTPEVKRYLKDGFHSLFSAVPGLGGAILISASEHHSHCYGHTGIKGHGILCCNEGEISCPRCSKRTPQDVITELIGLINDGIKSANPAAKVIAWNWSWSLYEKDPQKSIIEGLPAGVILMADNERGGKRVMNGKPHMVDEYSLCYTGPSERFKGSARTAKAAGREMYAKLQIGTTHELATVPYFPLPLNVSEKLLRLNRLGVKGSMECWNFGNMLSLNTEVANWFSWKPFPKSAEELLKRIAVRDTGVKAAPAFVRAWKQFSKAADHFPISMDFLYWGPANAGPAYPLLFKREDRHMPPTHLLPKEVVYNFKKKSLTFTEYGDNLENFCGVFSPEETVAMLKKFCAAWKNGVDGMERALSAVPESLRTTAESHYAVAAAVLRQLTSARHVTEFLWLRNMLPEQSSCVKRRQLIVRMRNVAEAELDNAGKALELLAMDSRLGFHGEGFGYMYTPKKIDQKIKGLKKLLANELAVDRSL